MIEKMLHYYFPQAIWSCIPNAKTIEDIIFHENAPSAEELENAFLRYEDEKDDIEKSFFDKHKFNDVNYALDAILAFLKNGDRVNLDELITRRGI